ncbi:MAG: hypothetical protein WBR26_13025 [Candidatus Acidiferrum sp.]
MNRSAIFIAGGLLFFGTAAAQRASSRPSDPNQRDSNSGQQATATLPSGAPIMAELTKTIDAKKAKQGEIVTARVTENTEANGKVLIPAGTKLEGHVTQASAGVKGASYSSVGIVFDKAVLKHGEEVPLNANVEALAAPAQIAETNTPDSGMNSQPMGGMPSQGMGNRSPGTMSPAPAADMNGPSNTEANNANAGTGATTGSLNSNGRLTPTSRGVFGMRGIGLTKATVGPQEAAIITSTGKDLHLDSGTQMLILTQAGTSKP